MHYISEDETPHLVVHEEFWNYWVCPQCGTEHWGNGNPSAGGRETSYDLYVPEGSIGYEFDLSGD